MKKLMVFAVAAMMTAFVVAEDKKETKKGECLAEGDSVAAFYVTDVTGPAAGETLCYRCKYGGRPVVSIFAREVDENVEKLVKEVDATVGKHEDEKMAAFVVVLSDEPDAQHDKLKEIAKKHKIEHTPLTVFKGKGGPKEYKLDKEAPLQVMMWVDGEVKVNESFEKGKFDKEALATLLKKTDKILN